MNKQTLNDNKFNSATVFTTNERYEALLQEFMKAGFTEKQAVFIISLFEQ